MLPLYNCKSHTFQCLSLDLDPQYNSADCLSADPNQKQLKPDHTPERPATALSTSERPVAPQGHLNGAVRIVTTNHGFANVLKVRVDNSPSRSLECPRVHRLEATDWATCFLQSVAAETSAYEQQTWSRCMLWARLTAQLTFVNNSRMVASWATHRSGVTSPGVTSGITVSQRNIWLQLIFSSSNTLVIACAHYRHVFSFRSFSLQLHASHLQASLCCFKQTRCDLRFKIPLKCDQL